MQILSLSDLRIQGVGLWSTTAACQHTIYSFPYPYLQTNHWLQSPQSILLDREPLGGARRCECKSHTYMCVYIYALIDAGGGHSPRPRIYVCSHRGFATHSAKEGGSTVYSPRSTIDLVPDLRRGWKIALIYHFWLKALRVSFTEDRMQSQLLNRLLYVIINNVMEWNY